MARVCPEVEVRDWVRDRVRDRVVVEVWVEVEVRDRVIQMVFLLPCLAELDETTEKISEKQPHGREH